MRRPCRASSLRTLSISAVLGLGVGLVAPAAIRSDAEGTRDPARLQVTADEFTLVLSRASIRRGPAIIELLNVGEDDHDLALRRFGKGATTRRVPIAEPGEVTTGEFRLQPGRFRLWCTIADHRARGMRAILIVRP